MTPFSTDNFEIGNVLAQNTLIFSNRKVLVALRNNCKIKNTCRIFTYIFGTIPLIQDKNTIITASTISHYLIEGTRWNVFVWQDCAFSFSFWIKLSHRKTFVMLQTPCFRQNKNESNYYYCQIILSFGETEFNYNQWRKEIKSRG